MVSIDNVIECDLTREQLGAITRGIKFGRTLQEAYPGIANFWRLTGSLSKVVKILDIQTNYGVTYAVAKSAVHRAIAGHDGSFDLPAYGGLMSEEERKEIAMRNKVEGGRVGGLKGGCKGARKGHLTRGLTPWTDEETEFAYRLSQQPEYQWGRSSFSPGKPNNELIALELCQSQATQHLVNEFAAHP